MTDTIFALASASGRAGVAVIRVSGPDAGSTITRLTAMGMPQARRASRRRFVGPDGAVLDEGLVLWFPAPASFTGEDVAEYQIHGGRAVVGAMLEALQCCPGLRAAEPGEFTRRAFEHGKLDLTAAEGVADLVNAETEAQRRQALRQLQGELGQLYDRWRERLIGMLAHAEAAIDFPDEDLPMTIDASVRAEILSVLGEVERHLADGRRGERLREGLSIALIGAPNAGKSSLLNRLTQRDAAIVSTVAGTTRDVIEVHLDLSGYPVTIADTAGLRETRDEIEAEGVRRAIARAEQADVKVALFDAERWPDLDRETLRLIDDDTIIVVNKVDLRPVPEGAAICGRQAHRTSALRGEGLDGVLARLTDMAEARLGLGAAPSLTRTRHRHTLEECREALRRAGAAGLPELAAEDLRLAAAALGRITGRVDMEDILDRIFRDFCIGK